MTPRILIIAGSDSGGGAGIQADIRTVTMLGGHAMTAVTAITAQNTLGVQAAMPVPTELVMAQIRSCVDDIGVDAVKIGMLGSAQTARAVADWLPSPSPPRTRGPNFDAANANDGQELGPRVRGDDGRTIPVVFDPVMVATSGAVLADEATRVAMDRLAGCATLLTPNTDELAALAGFAVTDEIDQEHAARAIMARTGCPNVLAKGSHLPGARIFDFLYGSGPDNPGYTVWDDLRIDTRHTHGTGCTLASAVAVGLAEGMTLADAVARARRFVRAAIVAAPGFGAGHGPMGHQAVRLDPLPSGG